MNTEKKLIALVDDSHTNLFIGKQVLGKKYFVITAPSAKHLFSILENNTPALILLDISMPDMDGFETITILKTNPETRDIPVIFLTGRDGEEDKKAGLAMGAVDYIHKPYDPSLLLLRIETHLANINPVTQKG